MQPRALDGMVTAPATRIVGAPAHRALAAVAAASLLVAAAALSLAACVSGPRRAARVPERAAVLAGTPVSAFWADAPHASGEPAGRCRDTAPSAWRVALVDGAVRAVSVAGYERVVDPLPHGACRVPDVPAGLPDPGLGDQHVQRVPDGRLVGFDVGEFGGGLWYCDAAGAMREQLAADQVAGFVDSGAGLLAAVGLDHLGAQRGALLRLRRTGARPAWVAEPFATLPGRPWAWTREGADGALLIATMPALVRVEPSGATRALHPARWMSPTSVVREPSTGRIYVGMRGVVARLTPAGDAGFSEEWLWRLPCPAPTFDEERLECLCRGGSAAR